MTKGSRAIVFGVFFFILSSFQLTSFSEDSGDDKIGDMIKEIEKREKEQKEKDKQERNDIESEKDSSGGCMGAIMGAVIEGCARGCFEALFEALGNAALHIDYADYPYSDSGSDNGTPTETKPSTDSSGKIASLKLTFEPSYLQNGIWGMSGRCEGALTFFYANFIYQYNFSSNRNFSVLSFNGGLQIPISNVAFRTFVGGFGMPGVLDSLLFSFGGGLEIFFPQGIVFEIYSLNAITDYLWFLVVSPSISIALWRFNIGAGFNYYNYTGTEYYGPFIKISFWI